MGSACTAVGRLCSDLLAAAGSRGAEHGVTPGTNSENTLPGIFPLALLAGRTAHFADSGAAEEQQRFVLSLSGTCFPKAASRTWSTEHVEFLCARVVPLLQCVC